MSLEQPVLLLGLAGFSDRQGEKLAAMLSGTRPGWPVWQVAQFSDADAWWVNGQAVALLQDGTVRVKSSQAGQLPLKLNMHEIDRPVAFAAPVATEGFEPTYTFDPASETSALGVLQQFEGWLRPLRAQFALGAQVIAREGKLKPGVYHVSYKGNLLAVVNLRDWQVGLSPTARPIDFDDAQWDKRPDSASSIPEKFVRVSLTLLMWAYAQRTRNDVLPKRYRAATVYFRRAPRVPMRWLKDAHLVLLRELSTSPGTFENLRQRTGMGEQQLARDLASLYFAGSITSTKSNAAAGHRSREDTDGRGFSNSEPNPSPLGPDSRFTGRPPGQRREDDLTAPAPIQYED
jgi:hypothetical protein